jgi:hypothetical protein
MRSVMVFLVVLLDLARGGGRVDAAYAFNASAR